MRHILFATDGSAASNKAAEQVRTFLQASPEAKLTVLYVSPNVDPRLPLTIESAENEIAREIREETLSHLFQGFDNRTSFLHRRGSPAVEICEAARDLGADLIVVGSHGRGMIDRLVLGSVSAAVVHRATKPVLVAKV